MILCGLLLFGGGPAASRTIHVSQTGDDSSGASWQTAYRTIGRAIGNSHRGDDIWVRQGVYREWIEMAKGVDLFGGFTGTEGLNEFDQRDAVNNRTVIDASTLHARTVIANDEALLDGFTITGGGREGHTGGGIVCQDRSPIVANCIIEGNLSLGIVDTDCDDDCYYCWPYGSCCDTYCYDEVKGAQGAGVYLNDSYAIFINCIIRNNKSIAPRDAWGGGVYVEGGAPVFEKCTIELNQANSSYSAGGGVHLYETTAAFRNCEILNNDAIGHVGIGAGIFTADASIILENCTLSGNVADHAGDGLYLGYNTFGTISSSILWGNYLQEIYSYDRRDVRVSYSNIEGGWAGTGNIDQDPKFRSISDFRLQPDSPCIDVAAVRGPDEDLLGVRRPIDVPGVGRDGTQDEYDMGAYEFQPRPMATPTPTPTPSPTATATATPTPTPTPTSKPGFKYDLETDGVVNRLDLIYLLEGGMSDFGMQKSMVPFDFSLYWNSKVGKE